MNDVVSAVSNASQGASGFVSNFLASVTMWQVALVAAILLVLVIIVICALVSKNRKYDRLMEDKEREKYAAQRAEKESRDALIAKDDTLSRVKRDGEAALEKAKDEADAIIAEKGEEIGRLTGQVEDLTRFKNEYVAIPNARTEAARIVREAKEHAYVVSNRTEMEYTEIIEHANQEAEAIRGMAQQRLTRSHEALRQALARANEIVEEARVEAARIAKIAYVPGPGLIEAPIETEREQTPLDETENVKLSIEETDQIPETTPEGEEAK